MRHLFAAALLLAPLPAVAQAQPAPAPAAAPSASVPEVKAALERGERLYYYDFASALATDDYLAKAPGGRQQVRGWIVEGPPQDTVVSFYGDGADGPRILYSARFDRGRPVSSHLAAEGEQQPLTPAQKALAAARDAAAVAIAQAKVQPCGAPYFNALPLAGERPGDPVRVYFLSPRALEKSVPGGGHYVIEVPPDGVPRTIHGFSDICIELPVTAPGGGPVQALGIAHRVDLMPTEIDAYLTLLSALPSRIVTADRTAWILEIANGAPRVAHVVPAAPQP
ncbi:hypothetical protein ACFQ1E_19445 [Sphingomonas canadensis]|uniref:DUF2987 domain-containing protein n=1 Tax=Sphingomonas canadensis TaxID=1219257 RepID=A0ABW3HBG4_9SPHN|nr:hypothetical protein [Sphingomonas canadensis]MCW3838141.1 hypothetical protein [Sphingomonas canadensis]